MGVLDFLGTTAATNVANLALSGLQMYREDHAVERRVRDLEAAGLNPVLAAGSAAQSQAPMAMRSSGGMGPGTEVAVARSQAAMTESQADLLAAQARKANAEAAVMEGSTTLPDGTPGTWVSMMLMKLAGEATGSYTKGQEEFAEYNWVTRFDQATRSVIAQTMKDHAGELARIDLQLQREGLTGAKLDNQRLRYLVSILRKDERFYEADKIAGYVSSAVGAGARLTGAMAGWRGSGRELTRIQNIYPPKGGRYGPR